MPLQKLVHIALLHQKVFSNSGSIWWWNVQVQSSTAKAWQGNCGGENKKKCQKHEEQIQFPSKIEYRSLSCSPLWYNQLNLNFFKKLYLDGSTFCIYVYTYTLGYAVYVYIDTVFNQRTSHSLLLYNFILKQNLPYCI